jgi:hypothetical protein
MPPLIVWTLGAIGAAALASFVIREARRINAELDELRKGRGAPEPYPTLRRDPASGEYRLR